MPKTGTIIFYISFSLLEWTDALKLKHSATLKKKEIEKERERNCERELKNVRNGESLLFRQFLLLWGIYDCVDDQSHTQELSGNSRVPNLYQLKCVEVNAWQRMERCLNKQKQKCCSIFKCRSGCKSAIYKIPQCKQSHYNVFQPDAMHQVSNDKQFVLNTELLHGNYMQTEPMWLWMYRLQICGADFWTKELTNWIINTVSYCQCVTVCCLTVFTHCSQTDFEF